MPLTPTLNRLEHGKLVRDGFAGYDRADVEKKIEALADDDPRAVAALQRLDRWMKSKGMHVRDLFSRFAEGGELEPHELEAVLRRSGTHFSDDEMVAMLKCLDEDCNGVIDPMEMEVALRGARKRARGNIADAHRSMMDELEANLTARREARIRAAMPQMWQRRHQPCADGELPC